MFLRFLATRAGGDEAISRCAKTGHRENSDGRPADPNVAENARKSDREMGSG